MKIKKEDFYFKPGKALDNKGPDSRIYWIGFTYPSVLTIKPG